MNISDKKSITDVDVKGKKVVVRVDFNVPISASGEVDDDTRIRATIPTLKLIKEKGASKIVLISHCGRPDGRKQAKYSLKCVVQPLSKLLGEDVVFCSEGSVGPAVEKCIADAKEGSVILLENIRFYGEEEGSSVNEAGEKVKATEQSKEEFRNQITRLGDVMVNDAFGAAHRAHSSIVGFQGPKVAGLLMKKELDFFGKALDNPARPFLSILGGAKVRDKIKLIENLLDKVDVMIIGGGMAYTFLKVMHNMKIGNSLYDSEGASMVPRLVEKAASKGVTLVFPVDFVISNKFGIDGIIKSADLKEGIPEGFEGLDCGPESIKAAEAVIAAAKTIVWNGPQGVFELEPFAKGSNAFLAAVVKATKDGAVTIVGGGDTASLVEKAGQAGNVSHVSTGGGASLELLEGKTLPGLAALDDKDKQ